MEYDNTAYDVIHFMKVDAPCLSFDILTDNLGYERRRVRELPLSRLHLRFSSVFGLPDTRRIEKMTDLSDPPSVFASNSFRPLPAPFFRSLFPATPEI